MPRKDGTGPDGKGPKKINQGVPTPKRARDGSGNRNGQGGGSNKGRGRGVKRGQ